MIAIECYTCQSQPGISLNQRVVLPSQLLSGNDLELFFMNASAEYIAVVKEGADVIFTKEQLKRVEQLLLNHSPALMYTDYISTGGERVGLIDYQSGSVRDDFDFGGMIFINTKLARSCLPLSKSQFAGLYELRLKLSDVGEIVHVPEGLYTLSKKSDTSHDAHFAYLAKNAGARQREYEEVFKHWSKKQGFYIPAERLKTVSNFVGDFPVEASVVIPVRDRVNTISDAVRSAVTQKTDFKFNVVVVDNYSNDGSYEQIEKLSLADPKIHLIRPTHKGLGIGGCWNFAVNYERVGRFVVQLDSDDLYSNNNSLQKIVECFYAEKVAAVVGSYQLVDFNLQELPPGLIDHREWTADNGHNNGLRINGFGAPRAYYQPIAKEVGFPDVSYGEDYAMMLAITREYKIGRIYESLYLCRRWPGNSDAQPSWQTINRFNTYKDFLRTCEIKARKCRNNSAIS